MPEEDMFRSARASMVVSDSQNFSDRYKARYLGLRLIRNFRKKRTKGS